MDLSLNFGGMLSKLFFVKHCFHKSSKMAWYAKLSAHFCLQLGEDLLDPSGFTSLLGGTTYLLAGISAILALWKTAKIT